MAIRMGILGFGGMGNWHADNAPKVEGVEVVCVHDIDPARLADARKRGLRAYERREDFLSDPDTNLVLIATPNDLHRDLAIEALLAGKNVMCEKPVTLTLKELDDVIKVSRETGRLFTVHQNRRWDRDYLVMRNVVESGALGSVHTIESRLYGYKGYLYGWRARRASGGGMLLDWGVHMLDQFTFMYPYRKIRSVSARLHQVFCEEVDDLFIVDMAFEGGPDVRVQIGTFGLIKPPRFFACGDRGTLRIADFGAREGEIVRLRYFDNESGRVITTTEAGPTRTMAPQPEECVERLPLPEITENWTQLYRNLSDALEGKADLIVSPSSVRRTMQLIEAVRKSARSGLTVSTDL
ncbi:MAG: Gfo/Idh/MocA family oxidoreductase [Clostridiales bacterium]|nr:Gfo/Idh/MocA family oxidoreductase [Clostridiales bacterium]